MVPLAGQCAIEEMPPFPCFPYYNINKLGNSHLVVILIISDRHYSYQPSPVSRAQPKVHLLKSAWTHGSYPATYPGVIGVRMASYSPGTHAITSTITKHGSILCLDSFHAINLPRLWIYYHIKSSFLKPSLYLSLMNLVKIVPCFITNYIVGRDWISPSQLYSFRDGRHAD